MTQSKQGTTLRFGGQSPPEWGSKVAGSRAVQELLRSPFANPEPLFCACTLPSSRAWLTLGRSRLRAWCLDPKLNTEWDLHWKKKLIILICISLKIVVHNRAFSCFQWFPLWILLFACSAADLLCESSCPLVPSHLVWGDFLSKRQCCSKSWLCSLCQFLCFATR